MKLQWFTNDIDSGNGDSKPDLFLSTQGKSRCTITLNFKMCS